MNNSIDTDSINNLNKAQDEQLKKLHLIVKDAIKEERLIIDELQHRRKKFYLPDKSFLIKWLYLAAVGSSLFYSYLF